MHEHKLVSGVREKVREVARAQGAERVTGVRVRLSDASHVTPDQFREHFKLIAAGTVAEAADLDVGVEQGLNGELRLDSIDVSE